MDRGQVVSGKSSAKQTLSNDVIKDVNAVKNGNVYELDPKLWYFRRFNFNNNQTN